MLTDKSKDKRRKHSETPASEANRANNISLASVIVNGLIFFITAVLAGVAIWQAKSADNSAQTAERTFKADSSNNERILKSQKVVARKSDSLDSIKYIRDTSAFGLQKRIGEAQIKSFDETKKEFEIENRPFLAIGQFRTDTGAIGKKLFYSAILANAGKQPAFIIKAYFDFKISNDSLYNNIENIKESKDIKNEYLPNNQYKPINGSSDQVVSPSIYFIEFYNKKAFVYLRGYFVYKGLAANKIYHLKFIYRVQASPFQQAATIYYKAD